jgi:hypothetical protein
VASIDSYLDRACARLHANPAEVEDIRREIRLHLEDMIAEYCAEGMTRPEAAERAIAWLGEAEQIRAGLELVHHGDPGWMRRLKGVALGGLLGAILSRWAGACLLPTGLAAHSAAGDALVGLATGCCIGLLSNSRSGLVTGLAVGSLTRFAARVGGLASPLASASTSDSMVQATREALLALILGGIFGLAVAAGSRAMLSVLSRYRRDPG